MWNERKATWTSKKWKKSKLNKHAMKEKRNEKRQTEVRVEKAWNETKAKWTRMKWNKGGLRKQETK